MGYGYKRSTEERCERNVVNHLQRINATHLYLLEGLVLNNILLIINLKNILHINIKHLFPCRPGQQKLRSGRQGPSSFHEYLCRKRNDAAINFYFYTCINMKSRFLSLYLDGEKKTMNYQ